MLHEEVLGDLNNFSFLTAATEWQSYETQHKPNQLKNKGKGKKAQLSFSVLWRRKGVE